MFGCILVPLDGSEAASGAVSVAADVARRFHGRVVLLQVIGQLLDWHHSLPTPTDCVGMDDIEERAAHAARSQLSRLATTIHGVPVDVDVRFGRVAETILEVATEIGAELICLAAPGHEAHPGTNRSHRLSYSAFSGLGERLMHTSPVPVLILGADAAAMAAAENCAPAAQPVGY